MKQLRSLVLASALAALATTVAYTPAHAQVPAAGQGPLASLAPAQDETGYEQMTQSPVAFWKGMSHKDFDARTVATADGKRTLGFGPYVFTTGVVRFDDNDRLTALSLEYRNDDPTQIRNAFEAYRHALGSLKPDYEREGGPNEQVPDLDFAMIGWKGPNGAESALARVHSYEAARVAKTPVKAGVVTFAVRPTP